MIDLLKKSIVTALFFVCVFAVVHEADGLAERLAAFESTAPSPSEDAGGGELDPQKLNPKERELYDRIVSEAQRLQEAAIDAREDRVWKAIPAVNGREVDIARTFEYALKQEPSQPIPFVFREVAPQVTLDDLGPLPIYKGNPRKPMVSLMINVAWKEENLPAMLQTLREENVKATFFFLGSWLKKHPEEAQAIAAEGHELANHAYWHITPLSKLSDADVRKEIADTQQLLKDTFGVEATLFAPPSGDYNMNTVRVAHELGLRTILWSLDTVDWKDPPPESIIRKISQRIEPGSLILMHPTASARDALQGIIREAKRKGFALGTVSETISPTRAPAVEP